MLESKLLKNIKKLDSKTKERFKTFVTSPYFNQHKKTIELLNYLYKHMNTKRPERLNREYVFKKLFPNQAYSEQILFNVMSSLKKLYHRFLAQQRFEEQAFQEDNYLLEACFLKHEFDLLKNRSKKLDKQLDQFPFSNQEYYYAKFQQLKTMAYYNSLFEDRGKSNLFQLLNDNLDRYYIVEKLRHSCELASHMLLMNVQFDFGLLDEVLRFYESNSERFAEDPAIRLYYTILMNLRNEQDPQYYHQMKEILSNEIHLFSPQDQSNLYSHANNYCIRQINKGNPLYQKELFELYRQGLTTELIFDNGFLNEWNYKNITVLGCQAKEFEWTEYFLETYKSKLPASSQENAYNYNMAHLNYSKQNYNDALGHLLHVRFSDVKYHLNYNNLLLATYYALGDTEALMSHIDTFRIYVMRNKKLTTVQKKQYTSFLRFAKNIVNVKQLPIGIGRREKKEKFAHLYFKIKESSNLVNRYWLENTCKREAGNIIDEMIAAREAEEAS